MRLLLLASVVSHWDAMKPSALRASAGFGSLGLPLTYEADVWALQGEAQVHTTAALEVASIDVECYSSLPLSTQPPPFSLPRVTNSGLPPSTKALLDQGLCDTARWEG
jgi:hypothetical protein